MVVEGNKKPIIFCFGCSAVGRAVASDTEDIRFESSRLQNKHQKGMDGVLDVNLDGNLSRLVLGAIIKSNQPLI